MARTLQRRPFSSSITIHSSENLVHGNSMFDVSGGSLTVRCTSHWDRGSNPPDHFLIKPINEGFGFWNPDGDEKSFIIGTQTQTWSNLDDGRYHLRFEVNDHAPKELLIDVLVS